MTPTDEATFMQLWTEGASYADIAQAMQLKLGTVASCAKRLADQGKIARRPRGGAYPKQRALARQDGPRVSDDTPGVSRRGQTTDTGAVQPLDTGPVQRLDRLEDEVQGLRLLLQSVIDRLDHPPVQTPVQITTLPPYPKGKAVRWNLWILDSIKEQISTLAAERDLSPSELVQEYLWKALTDRQSSTP